MFKLKNVNFYYEKKNQILKDINLNLEKGKLYVVMGENGSGKSTLLMLLKGIHRPISGELLFKNKREKKFFRDVGFIFQDPDIQLIGPDVESDLEFGPLNLGWKIPNVKDKVKKVMEMCDITHLKNKNPYNLSYGEKRRVAIAGVLAMEPEVLILDEPTTWLDPYHQEQLKELLKKLKEEGKTIILSTHDLQFANELNGEHILIKDGRIMAEGGRELLQNLDLLKECRLYYRGR